MRASPEPRQVIYRPIQVKYDHTNTIINIQPALVSVLQSIQFVVAIEARMQVLVACLAVVILLLFRSFPPCLVRQ